MPAEPVDTTASDPDEAPSEPTPGIGAVPDPAEAIEPHQPEQVHLIDADALGRPATATGSAIVGLSVIPPEQEMRALAQLANTLAMAEACPKPLRQKPNDVFLVLLTARDLGTAITTALREFHVIDGRVTLSPKVKLAMVRSRPDLGRVRPGPDNNAESATWHSWRADGDGTCVSSTFTWQDGQVAHLVDSRCTAYEHWSKNGQNCLCKNNWKAWPKRMLSWRALGYLLDDEYPEVGTGLYSPDEMGAVTDADGEPIPVTAVESLPGMKQTRGQKAAEGSEDEDPPAVPEDVAEMTNRLHAAKDHADAKAELQAWWNEREIGPVAALPARKVAMVRARFTALEKKHGYDVPDPVPVAEGQEAAPEPERGAESQNGAEEQAPDEWQPEQGPLWCEGDVAGWLIVRVGQMTAAEIKKAYRDAGEKVPDGNVTTLRGLWSRREFEQIGSALLALFQLEAPGPVDA